jgi:hypothetical protein
MFTGPLPVLVRAIVWEVLLPTFTLPKFTLVALVESFPVARLESAEKTTSRK